MIRLAAANVGELVKCVSESRIAGLAHHDHLQFRRSPSFSDHLDVPLAARLRGLEEQREIIQRDIDETEDAIAAASPAIIRAKARDLHIALREKELDREKRPIRGSHDEDIARGSHLNLSP